MLVYKRHAHGFTDFHFAAVWLLFASDEFEQGGLTRAVGADDTDDGTGRYLKAQVINQHAVTKRFGDVFEFNHFVAQAFGHGNENLLCFVARLVFVIRQFFKAGQARFAFGLTRFGVLA